MGGYDTFVVTVVISSWDCTHSYAGCGRVGMEAHSKISSS
jgi:hypothetical protein